MFVIIVTVLAGAVRAGKHQTSAPQIVLAGDHVACNVAFFGAMLINIILFLVDEVLADVLEVKEMNREKNQN